jgi:capsular polysaccharide biosynthesis protein
MQPEHNNLETEEQSVLGGIDIGIFKYDVSVFLISLRRRMPLLLLIPIIITAATFAYVFSLPQSWKATCVLFKSTVESAKENELSTLRRPISMEAIREMIRTRKNMRDVISNLKLSTSLQGLYGATSVEISEDNKNMINIHAIASSPQESAQVANELAEVFLVNYEKMRNRNIQKRYDYFSHQKLIVINKINKLEDEREAYLDTHNITTSALEMKKDHKLLSELEDKIIKAEQKQHALKIQVHEYKSQIKALEPEIKLSYEVTAVDDTALVMKKNELETLRQRYTDLNPKVKKVISEIESLERKLEKQKQEKRPARKITYGKNWHITNLEDQIFKAETELKGIDFLLNKYNKQKPLLEARVDKLNETADEYREIKRKITLNEEVLRKIDKGVTEMNLALSSSVSDLRIFEPAEPPVYPVVSKKRKKLLIGVFLGVVLAGMCAILLEVIDLTIKSQFDIEKVLHINAFGSLPKINEIKLKRFYSAVQIVFNRIFQRYTDTNDKKILIAFGDVEGKTGKTFFIKKLIDIFGPMDKKILYISSCSELASGLQKYKINDFIYGNEKIEPGLAQENNDHLYFLLDNYSYIVPIKAVQIEALLDKFSDYDYIFWELFEFKNNEPLFATICSKAQTTVLMTKFKKSNKLALLKCVRYLTEHNVKNIGAIINSVEKRYFNKGI